MSVYCRQRTSLRRHQQWAPVQYGQKMLAMLWAANWLGALWTTSKPFHFSTLLPFGLSSSITLYVRTIQPSRHQTNDRHYAKNEQRCPYMEANCFPMAHWIIRDTWLPGIPCFFWGGGVVAPCCVMVVYQRFGVPIFLQLLQPWRWRQLHTPKRWYPITTLHAATQQTTITVFIAVKTSNLTITSNNNWKPIASRPTGRPKNRWDDDVRKDLKIMRVCNWKDCAKDRNKWKLIVERAKTLMEL
jgi:hypothetical protein